jgi:site-specific DNA-methyltransferase (adenine-specific)
MINTIIHGDCLELMKDNNISPFNGLIVTDPPYIHEKGGRGKMLLCETLDRNQFNMKELGDFGEKDINEFMNTTKRLMNKPQWYIFCSEKQVVYYLNWAVSNKFKYNILTWNKPLSILNRERYSTNIEYIIRVYSIGCALNKLNLDLYPEKSDYYSKYKSFKQIRSNKLHPSQKPIEIISQIIELSSNEDDIILDPFAGSGSTAIACINTNRNYILMEKEQKYYDIIQDRIK